MTARKLALATTLLALAALGGCHKPAPPPEQPDNAAPVEANIATPSETPAPANAVAPVDANAAAAADLRETPPAPDAQTQDDADATGMTAHVKRDEAAGNATNP